jgi:hypothetical protein
MNLVVWLDNSLCLETRGRVDLLLDQFNIQIPEEVFEVALEVVCGLHFCSIPSGVRSEFKLYINIVISQVHDLLSLRAVVPIVDVPLDEVRRTVLIQENELAVDKEHNTQVCEKGETDSPA